jgi:type IV pilus assembly protein PilM
MGILDLLSRREPVIAIDIGTTSLKAIEIDLTQDRPAVISFGVMPLKSEILSNTNTVSVSKLADALTELFDATNLIETKKRICACVPAPSIFTKRTKVPQMKYFNLRAHIEFEAANFLPSGMSNVRMDFHPITAIGKNQIEVLVVAVKNDVFDSLLDGIEGAGLQTAIVDIDCFALQNMFELNYPEHESKTVALINIGSRFSAINVVRGGESLVVGDVNIGGKFITESLAAATGITFEEVERIKCGLDNNEAEPQKKDFYLALNLAKSQFAQEIHKKLNLLCDSVAVDGLDMVFISGGGSSLPGLIDELKDRTNVAIETINPLKEIDIAPEVDQALIDKHRSSLGVLVGLGLRQVGDRVTSV